jgi:agmatinase
MNESKQAQMDAYRQHAMRNLENHRDPRIGSFYKRCSEEQAPIFTPAYSVTEKTFYRAPRRDSLEDVDIACIGVPMQVSAPYFGGQNYGPNALRDSSLTYGGPIHERWNTIPFDLCSIADFGNVDFSRPHNTQQTVEEIYNAYCEVNDAGVVPLTVGGVHTVSHPILKALGREQPLGLIHIDAHADTMTGEMQGEELSDGAVFRHAVLDQGIDPARTVQIGIRGAYTHYWNFSYDSGMRVITIDDFDEMGLPKVLEEVRKIIGDGPCYLTLDCDGIDANYLPGTQLPEPFGLTSREVRNLLRGLRGLDLVGADIVELCPLVDVRDTSSNLMAALGFEMLCLLAEARQARTGETRQTHW